MGAPGAGALLPGEVDPGSTLLFVGSSGGKLFGLAAPSLGTPSLQQDQPADSPAAFPEWLAARLGDLAVLLLLGGLIMWLRPALIQWPAEGLRRKPLPATGFGLLALTLAINVVAIAVLLGVLLFVVGIWLGGVTLWELAFLLWGIGYPALILACSLFALTVVYGSKLVVANLGGTLILQRLAPTSLEGGGRFLPLLLGLVLYVILRSVPILGWAVEVIVTVLGLGALWVALRRQRSALVESPALPEAGELEID